MKEEAPADNVSNTQELRELYIPVFEGASSISTEVEDRSRICYEPISNDNLLNTFYHYEEYREQHDGAVETMYGLVWIQQEAYDTRKPQRRWILVRTIWSCKRYVAHLYYDEPLSERALLVLARKFQRCLVEKRPFLRQEFAAMTLEDHATRIPDDGFDHWLG